MTAAGTGSAAWPLLPAGARARFADAVRAEWVKLRTVRSTYWSLLATVLLVTGLGAVFSLAYASRYHPLSPPAKATFDATVTSLSGASP